MFTGLIETRGRVADLKRSPQQNGLVIASQLPVAELSLGESIAVNGACLTVSGLQDDRFVADVSPETLEKTTLGDLERGAVVNLERALKLSDRLGGHLVTGHVDGTGMLVDRQRAANAWRLRFRVDAEFATLLVPKGSVAVDGISLTVNDVGQESFEVMIIPHTLEMTTLQDLQVGSRVNIETDLIGKYVARLLGSGDRSRGVSLELLAKHGYL